MATCKAVEFVVLIAIFVGSPVFGETYYVSPSGLDSNPGTVDQPWQTFNHAFSPAPGKLVAGDTLYLRAGTYYNNGVEINITCDGNSQAPITIQAYPGESATISGALPDFESVPNSGWTVVDANKNLYKSVNTIPAGNTNNGIGAWLPDDDIQIIHYSHEANDANMDSNNYTQNGRNPCYYGPGINRRADGKLYIRLAPNPNDLFDISGNPISAVPANYNPNQNRIAVYNLRILFYLTGANYIHFKNLHFAYSEYSCDATNSTHIEFDNCRFDFGSYGIVLRAGNTDWNIHDCEFTNGMPDWVTWTDVKVEGNPKEAYPEFQSNALSGEGGMVNFVIERNTFRNIFDGMDVPSGSLNVIVRRNIFKYSKDDAMNIFKDVNNIEIAYNMFWRIASGISCLTPYRYPTSEPTGPVYIHHNVIDNSHLLRLGRPVSADGRWGSKVWVTLDPFASHDDGDRYAWWRLYNNTIITRFDEPYRASAGPYCVWGNSEKYVYNNIFFSRDSRKILSNDQISSGSHYDGDILYQTGTDQFLLDNFGNGGYYLHLANFRAANPTSDWEVNGLEINPQFDFTKIDNPVYDANIWERYRPANSQVFTQGHSYASLNWPATEYVKYRGAIPLEGANLNETGLVDFADFAIFAKHWLEADCFPPLYCQGTDINKHDGVDMQDLDEFAADWLN